MRRLSLKGLNGLLFAQAGMGAFFALAFNAASGNRLVGLQLVIALAAACVGVYLRCDGVHSRDVVLWFEGLAVLAGLYGLSQHIYLFGTLWAISVLAQCAGLPRHVPIRPAFAPHPEYQAAPCPPVTYQATPYQAAPYRPTPYQSAPPTPMPYQAAAPQGPPSYGLDFWGPPAQQQPQPAQPSGQ